MAHNNCSYFEAEKLLEGRDMKVPINYDRYLSPQSWPSLPSTSKAEFRIKGVDSLTIATPLKEKNVQYKRPSDKEQDSDKEKKASKVRILDNKQNNDINERRIRDNIKKSNNEEHIKERRDPKRLAFMANFNDNIENISRQVENVSPSLEIEEEQYVRKETIGNKDFIEKRALKFNKLKNLSNKARDKTRTRITYRNI
ncbi:unnamed protein product [Lasius platythorax]|uniref:Uncharacterized protein n=1 Tax=Lasius platythorax TaxID=488582 RepID=A0AAV2P2X6_9HYME